MEQPSQILELETLIDVKIYYKLSNDNIAPKLKSVTEEVIYSDDEPKETIGLKYIVEIEKWPMTLQEYQEEHGVIPPRVLRNIHKIQNDLLYKYYIKLGDIKLEDIVINPNTLEVRFTNFDDSVYFEDLINDPILGPAAHEFITTGRWFH